MLARILTSYMCTGTAQQGSIFLGGAVTGADEDDFHALHRNQDATGSEEKKEQGVEGEHQPTFVPAKRTAKKVVNF